MELELIKVVEYGVFIGVDGAVVVETTTERLISVVSADHDYLRQINHSLTQEVITGVHRHSKFRHYQPVVSQLTSLLLVFP